MTAATRRGLERVRAIVPASAREGYYRAVSAVATLLLGLGVLDDQTGALWVQLGLSVVTLLFALMYATTPWRIALYATLAPLGAVLGVYGLVSDARWAAIVAAAGLLFGTTTAAAKARDYSLAA